MIMRSLVHRRPRHRLPAGQRRSPVAGPRHKGAFPGRGWARRPGPAAAPFGGAREQAARATQSNNYWSSTTYQNNPTNAWNVNFNDGNVNANNKSNTFYVRAVRGGSWSVESPRWHWPAGRGPVSGAAGGWPPAARR
ncbi:DUF1566 domain-containing protein [bacterium]|nr:DUF1566 domain-containing protein [bacterium]